MLKEREHSPCANIGTITNNDAVTCAGCGSRIHDRYYLFAVDKQWHAACLKCCECKLSLDSELSCFSRDGNIYCKEDYYRMYAVSRCGRCHAGISANELVMRAKDLVYHLHCFSCMSCGIALAKGDHFGMRDGFVYCRPHYELLDFCESVDPVETLFSEDSQSGYFSSIHQHPHLKGRPRKRKIHPDETPDPVTMRMAASLEIIHQGELSSSMESLSYESSVTSPASSNGTQHSQRTKRMRTSFKHHQLRTMKTYFAINQNPDAKDLKQLAQKTGLSKRVLQVWFQNARAKWRRNVMRQEVVQNVNHNAQGSCSNSNTGTTNLRHQSLDNDHNQLQSINSQVISYSDSF